MYLKDEEVKDLFLDCDKNDTFTRSYTDMSGNEHITKHSKRLLQDNVEQPKHYQIGIDTFTRMRANATYEEAMGFIRWNIDKYNTRAKGQDEEDYKKIEAYCKEALWWFTNRRAKE